MNLMLETLAVLPEDGEGITTADAARALGIDRGAAIVRLNRLVQVGRARVAGPGTRSHPKRWWRVPEGKRLADVEVRLVALAHAAAGVMRFLASERRTPEQQEKIDALGRETIAATRRTKGFINQPGETNGTEN